MYYLVIKSDFILAIVYLPYYGGATVSTGVSELGDACRESYLSR